MSKVEQARQDNRSTEEVSERRRRRSDDVITALHYQLSAVRARAGLGAVVLVDDSGCLVAGAGAWPACEELAAYAPLFVHPAEVRNNRVGSRVAALSRAVDVQTLQIDGAEALLCGHGGPAADRRAIMAQAAIGCRRILGAA